MKRHVSLFSVSVKTSAAEFFVSLTFVLQFILGWSNQTEMHLSVFFHFNQRIPNRQTDSSICIGPFSSDVSSNCGFDHHINGMDCFKCYTHGCRNTRNFLDITSINLTVGIFSTGSNQNLKRILDTKKILFVDLEMKCTWLKMEPFLEWYVTWCEYNRWPIDRKPKCRDTITTRTGTVTETRLTYPVTWTTSSTELSITSYSNVTYSPPVTHQTWAPLGHQQNNNSTPASFGEKNPDKSHGNTILWISLGAAAGVFTVTVLIIVFCQRAKIAKFLRNSGNPDIADDAFYYRDLSMKRRENQPAPDIVMYENIIPSLLLHEPVCNELDLSVQHNLNPENAAAGMNSKPLEQKRDLKSYVDSIIFAELHKC